MLTTTDRRQLEARGIAPDEAERQLQLLREPPPATLLDRPCTTEDGIARLDAPAHDELITLAREAAAAGRVTKFVPASGAATRMFKDLIAASAPGQHPSATDAGRRFFERLDEFAFAAELRTASGCTRQPRDEEEARRVLDTLLSAMRYAELPKALIPFHRVGGVVRTAFEAQLLEGTQYTRDRSGTARTHFTVAPEFREEFEQLLAQVRGGVEDLTGTRLDVSFSEQHPSTDTIAASLEGEPFRTSDGSLLFRPAGHGALLHNLQKLAADLVVIKNIDNVQPFEASAEVVRWKQLLLGYLVKVSATLPHDRPVRVCGVVRNEGEPGGAPFWVREPSGESRPQIVESSQVNLDDLEQRRIFEASTHFNPVDLVCSLRSPGGSPWDLAAFVDPSAVFRARKSHEGRELLALERPGLWNGAMARWHTVFVEVPAATFAPVKTVFDLLRPQHQSL